MSGANQHIAAYIEVTVRDLERTLDSSLSHFHILSVTKTFQFQLGIFFEVQIFYFTFLLKYFFSPAFMAQWAVDHSHKFFFSSTEYLP